ncbi:MAG: class I SAM-dependent methyltransferase [Terriglobia bacterium]|nr:class I SAM-dependent methyltransferase [Terriglobia bacterium]
MRALQITPETTVLDVGGTSATWTALGARCPRVTLLNILPEQSPIFPYVQANALNIPFPDNSFDVVFSNSLIEHVGGWEDQQQCAREMSRVGKRLWIQTPNRRFPIEPHLLAPFIHWLPRSVQRVLIPLTPRSFFSDEFQSVMEVWNSTILLDEGQMRELFPNRNLHRERMLGLTKSFIVC